MWQLRMITLVSSGDVHVLPAETRFLGAVLSPYSGSVEVHYLAPDSCTSTRRYRFAVRRSGETLEDPEAIYLGAVVRTSPEGALAVYHVFAVADAPMS